MNLVDVLRVFQRFWALILVLVAAGLATAAVALMLVAPTYTAAARLFVSTQSLGTADELLQGSTYTQARMASYAVIASDPIVLDPVIRDLGLDTTADELSSRVTAIAEPNQLIIGITAKASNAGDAAKIANAVAKELSNVITKKIEAPVAGSDSLVSVTIVKRANPPASPSWPVSWIFLAAGAAGGLVLGIGLAFLLSALDSRVRHLDDLTRLSTVPLIGTISKDRRLQQRRPLELMEGTNTFAESARAIRTNLQFIDAGGVDRRVLLLTSSIPGEGKSTASVSLAAALAQSGSRVVLVDADLRNPSVANLTGLEGGAGLTDLLLGRAQIDDVAQTAGTAGNLWAITAGRIPPNPAELLGSQRFHDVVANLRSQFDYVIIDSPPVLAVADALEMSRAVDGVVLVVGIERVRGPQLETALTSLRQISASPIGLVANRLARTGVDAYGYYAYGYQMQAEEESRAKRKSEAVPTREEAPLAAEPAGEATDAAETTPVTLDTDDPVLVDTDSVIATGERRSRRQRD